MRNPVQEYEMARSLPIPELEKVMLGQSDTVSMAVAHAALREKMQAEVAKKGAAAAQQAQAPKVRDKDLMEARGLTSLPVDIPMTPGGITGMPTVKVAGGGHIQRFQAGGLGGAYTPSQFQNVGVRNPAPAASRTPSVGSFGKFASRLLGGPLGAVNLLADPNALNVGEEEYLEMLRRLKALGYTEDQIAAMPDEARKALASGAAVRIPEEFRTAPTTTTETAQPPGQQPPVQQPPAVPQVRIPSGTQGLPAKREMTEEEAIAIQNKFSPLEQVAAVGAANIESLAASQAEEKPLFEKTLIDNSDLFAQAREYAEKGVLSAAQEKELDVGAAYLKASAIVLSGRRKVREGLASLGVDISAAQKTFNKAERESKQALLNIKRAERAEKAGNDEKRFAYLQNANRETRNAINTYLTGIASVTGNDKKEAAKIFEDNLKRNDLIDLEGFKQTQANLRSAFEQGEATKRTNIMYGNNKDPIEKKILDMAVEAASSPAKKAALDALKNTDPLLYNRIMAKIRELSTVTSLPGNSLIRE